MKRISIEEEYKKNANDLRIEDVNTIQEWIKTQPHLPQIDGEDFEHFFLFN